MGQTHGNGLARVLVRVSTPDMLATGNRLIDLYSAPTHAQDPAIASIGPAPNRRNGGPGGFGEGFGYGGGIGGKGLGKGGRHNGFVGLRPYMC